ncbi:MAG: alpha/beta hydrolase [Planctomycetaceae bacterium]|nr:alpha/beta hydrolase [Planctomycetaceae bacterium]MBV8315926.1 alpha/beta hydrolase [Planctomycetaceae bacterium]MBV8554342.1 alpha/beta hydrolase [Planctomycetaceae bacterium]MBV8606593.1 alpha/beta hydrolase [Singulisphaera sp.]
MSRAGSKWAWSGLEMLEGRGLMSGGLSGVWEIPNIVYTDLGGPQHLDLYLPTGPAPAGGRPAILALPGGGWRWVDRNSLGITVGALARYGYVVAVADYAYASSTPGSPGVWPTDFEDVRDAVRWLRDNAGRFGIDPSRIAAWGESAGGHLANLLGTYPDGPVNPDGPPADPVGTPTGVSARVQAVVDFYGPTDLTSLYNEDPRDRPFLETFLGGTPDQYPGRYQAASPLLDVTPNDPPFFVIQGTADRANPYDQSTRFAASLRAAGVPTSFLLLPNVPHGFRLKLGTNLNLLPDVLDFLDSALNHHGVGVLPDGLYASRA